MKERTETNNIHPIVRILLSSIPWLIIVVGGTFSMHKIEVTAIEAHTTDVSLATIIKNNEHRLYEEKALSEKADFYQCLEAKRIDRDLRFLADSLDFDIAHVGSKHRNRMSMKSVRIFKESIIQDMTSRKCVDKASKGL